MNPRTVLSCKLVFAYLISAALGPFAQPAAAQSRNPESYVLLLERSAAITQGSTVNGSVGINQAGGVLSLTRFAKITGNNQAVGEKGKLNPSAQDFDCFTYLILSSTTCLRGTR